MISKITKNVYILIIISLLALSLLLALGTAFGEIANLELPEKINPVYLLGAIFCTISYWLISSYAWQEAVFSFSNIKIPFLYSFAQISLVLIGKYLPGKVWGMAIRGKDLTNMGVTGYQAVISSQAEQIISIHAGLVLGSIGWLFKEQPAYWQAIALLILLSVLSGALLNNTLVNSLLFFYKKFRNQSDFAKYSITFRTYILLFALYIMEWLLVGGILYFLWLLVFMGSFSIATISYVLAVNALAFVAGFLVIFSPGGIGVREGVMVAMLTAIISLPEAIYLSVLYRIWLVLADSVAGLLAIKILSDTYRNK